MEFDRSAEGLSEHIAKHIAEQIVMGELVEGERIQELRIAKELDVSRGSVREALLLLERTYLIDIFPRRGAIVSEMTAHQVTTLFDTSMLVLGNIIHQTTQAGQQSDDNRIERLNVSLVETVRIGDIEHFYEEIFVFITEQCQQIDNIYLNTIYHTLLPSLRRSYFLTLNISKRELQEALTLFQLVIEAILMRQSHQAAMFMENFCQHLCNLVLESLARMKQIELAWAKRSKRSS